MATCVESIGIGGHSCKHNILVSPYRSRTHFCRIASDRHTSIRDSLQFSRLENFTERSSQGSWTVLRMASLLKKTNFFSQLRSQSQSNEGAFAVSRRGLHVEPGLREKALLASDPALSQFKSHKKGVKRIKRIGDVLTVVVVAGCCYEIYVRATMREEARSAAGESN